MLHVRGAVLPVCEANSHAAVEELGDRHNHRADDGGRVAGPGGLDEALLLEGSQRHAGEESGQGHNDDDSHGGGCAAGRATGPRAALAG